MIPRLPLLLLSVREPGLAGGLSLQAALHQGVPAPGLVLRPGDIGVTGAHEDGVTAPGISHHLSQPASRARCLRVGVTHWTENHKRWNTIGEVMVVSFTKHSLSLLSLLS